MSPDRVAGRGGDAPDRQWQLIFDEPFIGEVLGPADPTGFVDLAGSRSCCSSSRGCCAAGLGLFTEFGEAPFPGGFSLGDGFPAVHCQHSGQSHIFAFSPRKSAVSVKRRRIQVKESATEVHGKLVLGPPKTHEVRKTILPAFVMDVLAEHMEGLADDGLVFTAPRGGPLRSSNFRRGVWTQACEKSGMPEGLLIHDLRDTAASLAVSSGASIKAVQRMLGHKSAAMTLDVYSGLFEDGLEDLADRIDAKFAAAHVIPVRPQRANLPRNA